MRLEIDVALEYRLTGDCAALLAIEAADTPQQTVHSSVLDIDGATLHRVAGEGGLGHRSWARVAGDRLVLRYRASVEVERPAVRLQDLAAAPMHALPGDVLSYLRPSRLCQSDLFTAFAASRFGHLDGGARIAAIRDWVAREIAYAPGSSHAQTSAADTFVARAGVCRDHAHMVCVLARAANIPARYASVYGAEVTPPDFHAVAEVWLDGAWHLIDSTGMCSTAGLVVIGAGRDACDVPFMETADWATMIRQSVRVSRG